MGGSEQQPSFIMLILGPVSGKLPITISLFHRYSYDIALNNVMTSVQMESGEDNTGTHQLCNRGIGSLAGKGYSQYT